MGTVPTKIFGVSEFFYRKFVKNIFEIGDPKNRGFWAFFQKSMSEISANWDKTCVLCCRFFENRGNMAMSKLPEMISL